MNGSGLSGLSYCYFLAASGAGESLKHKSSCLDMFMGRNVSRSAIEHCSYSQNEVMVLSVSTDSKDVYYCPASASNYHAFYGGRMEQWMMN
jgi:hypothetical protein